MRARQLTAALAALALGAGLAACGGEQVDVQVPTSTPPITVSEEELAGVSGGDPAQEDAGSSTDETTTDTTETTPDETTATPDAGTSAPAPETSAPAPQTETPPAPAPAPETETPVAPAPEDTGGATEAPAPTDDGADTGDTGGAGFQDFCQQNPGAC